jgi:hypothetical protein
VRVAGVVPDEGETVSHLLPEGTETANAVGESAETEMVRRLFWLGIPRGLARFSLASQLVGRAG